MAGTKPGHDNKLAIFKILRKSLEMLDAFRSGSQDAEARRRPRSHTPNAITTAPASANQGIACGRS